MLVDTDILKLKYDQIVVSPNPEKNVIKRHHLKISKELQ